MKHIKHILALLLLAIVMPVGAQQTFTNPILGGDFPDPSVMRDGNDYFLVNSSFDYVPGLVVYHSRDLVHWEPISFALREYIGSIWAPDIKKINGKFYIYFTVQGQRRTNCVVTATSAWGPWSEPVDLNIGDIDPCVVPTRDSLYLVMSGGKRWTLAEDGLSVKPGSLVKFYNGWQYPADWITEGFCLEGPKVYKIGKYFYYLSAEGGTAGPPTSHMVTVARSTSINGPWQNMPTNPLIHTYSRDEKWWSKGHGSLIDTPDGHWFCIYHAYENGYLSLGRQTLMQPVHFTSDGWIKADGGDAGKPMPIMLRQENTASRTSRLNEFRIGLDWRYYKHYDPRRATIIHNSITLQGQGQTLGDSAPLMFIAGTHSYEIEAEITLKGKARAGLCVYYNLNYNAGTAFDSSARYRYRRNAANKVGANNGNHLWLRLRNDRNIITAYWSNDGRTWERESWAQEISGFNHNTLGDFQSILPGIFCEGEGQATFSNFKYTILP